MANTDNSQMTIKATKPGSSPSTLRLLDAATTLREAPHEVDRAFLARQLVQCTLPHSNPGNIPIWSRENGRLTLSIQPEYTDGEHRYPYGVLPRLIMLWICTEAVRTKSRRLMLGPSFTAFMRELGLNPSNRGKRSDATRLRDQLTRLLHARICFHQNFVSGSHHGSSNIFLQVADQDQLWWNEDKDEQEGLFESWIDLGEKFYEAVTMSPVPLDLRAIQGLRNSPLALDLYSLVAHVTFRANKQNESQTIPWEGLQRQMGTDLPIRMFRLRIKAALRKLALVYPAMKVEVSTKGFTVSPAPTPIPAQTS